MFNARLVVRRSPGMPIEPTGYPVAKEALISNYEAMCPLLIAAAKKDSLIIPASGGAKGSTFEAFLGIVKHGELVDALSNLGWEPSDHFAPDLAFLKELSEDVDEWVVILPQVGGKGINRCLEDVGMRSLFFRTRRRGTLFGGISDPKHRYAAQTMAGVPGRLPYIDKVAEEWHGARRGSLLIYPLVEQDLKPLLSNDVIPKEDVVIAFTVVSPFGVRGASDRLVQFEAINKARERAAIVDDPRADRHSN